MPGEPQGVMLTALRSEPAPRGSVTDAMLARGRVRPLAERMHEPWWLCSSAAQCTEPARMLHVLQRGAAASIPHDLPPWALVEEALVVPLLSPGEITGERVRCFPVSVSQQDDRRVQLEVPSSMSLPGDGPCLLLLVPRSTAPERDRCRARAGTWVLVR